MLGAYGSIIGVHLRSVELAAANTCPAVRSSGSWVPITSSGLLSRHAAVRTVLRIGIMALSLVGVSFPRFGPSVCSYFQLLSLLATSPSAGLFLRPTALRYVRLVNLHAGIRSGSVTVIKSTDQPLGPANGRGNV